MSEDDLTPYLVAMRSYMPPEHAAFIAALEAGPDLRGAVVAADDEGELLGARSPSGDFDDLSPDCRGARLSAERIVPSESGGFCGDAYDDDDEEPPPLAKMVLGQVTCETKRTLVVDV